MAVPNAAFTVYADRRKAAPRKTITVADENFGPFTAVQTVVTVAAGAPILWEGDRAEHMFRITSGVVKVLRLLADGRRQIFGFLYPGDLLGLTSEDTYPYSADAVGSVALSRFPRRKVEQLAAISPLVARLLFCRSSDALIAAQNHMLLLGRKTAIEKVASFLLAMAHRADNDALYLPMNRTDIADYLGLTIESVSRALTQLRKAGLLRVDRNDIQITDRLEIERRSAG